MTGALTSLELFTGAGGLALGMAAAGFKHLGLYEWDKDACDSLRYNVQHSPQMKGWIIHEGDVTAQDFRSQAGKVDVLAGGAPCQPFSLGGKHRGNEDGRNMFPEVIRATRELAPRAVVIENVKGLLRPSFREYFEYILYQLELPELAPKSGEAWRAHKKRLVKARKQDGYSGLRYLVDFRLMNAADYGVPQRRERVFIVALHQAVGDVWKGVPQTHWEDALLYDKWVSKEYWDQHKLRPRPMPERLSARIEHLWSVGRPFLGNRWLTVRDALHGLPEPTRKDHAIFANHVANPGARSYPGHTGSPWDEPAKALKAGDHGVPGGENMLRKDSGKVRYFTVREAARLQGFPDEYVFQGSWGESFRQLGNAVPVQLAEAVALSVVRHLRAKPAFRVA